MKIFKSGKKADFRNHINCIFIVQNDTFLTIRIAYTFNPLAISR